MKNGDCKLPIQEDHCVFLKKPKPAIQAQNMKFSIIAGLFILLAVSLMIVVTFVSIKGMQELREEVEVLRTAMKDLQKKFDEEYNRNYTDIFDYYEAVLNKTQQNFDYEYEPHDYYNFEDDDVMYSEEDYNVRTDLNTKDAKQATAPPREKRSITGYTEDGLTVNAEHFDDERRRNNTYRKNYPYYYTTPPSSFPYPYYTKSKGSSEDEDQEPSLRSYNARRSRIMYPEDSFHTRMPENPDVELTNAHTRHRQRRLEIDEHHIRTGRMRPLPSAHFSGDTSKYVVGQHDNFRGNGHLRHLQRTYVDWTETGWFRALGMDQHFTLTDGVLTIKDPGLYFIYAQIYYFDQHDTNGFRVYRNENETLLQCTTMTHSTSPVMKSNTCFTAAANYLNENDRISLVDLSDSRYSLFEPGKSFFGVIKLGDVKIK